MEKKHNIVNWIIKRNNWFVIPAIWVLYFSSAILMLLGMIKLFYTILGIYKNIFNPDIIDLSMTISADFLSIIENYILSITFYILALGLYELFIGNAIPKKLSWIKITNINDLKSLLSKMCVLFLCIMIIQKITEWKNPLEMLYFGVVASLICVILIFYAKHLDK